MRLRLRRPAIAAALLLASVCVPALAPARAFAADPPLDPPAVPRRATGYWFAAADGGVFTYGEADFHGSMGGTRLVAPVVGTAATATGRGYWMVASDGGVFALGDAGYFGSMGGRHLNEPIVAMAATPSGHGYWMVASDGGIFTFGDAGYFGSTGAMTLNRPIVGIAATPTGRGYWLVASDGGIFTFGDAAFFGSTGGMTLNAPIVAMASTTSGDGYWVVATDGGIFTFGDARYYGSTGATKLNKPIVGMSQTGFGTGYWLVASDGGVFSFGDAPFYGSAGALQLASPVVAMAPHLEHGSIGSAAFYYPWWGTAAEDGYWRHWGHPDPNERTPVYQPPESIAADFYPARGPYSSSNASIIDQHMADLAGAGVGTVVISWWGRTSFEDERLALVVAAARRAGLRPAIHVEPYANRTPDSVAGDVLYLTSTYGIDEIWIYLADIYPSGAWRAVTDSFPGVTVWGNSHRAQNATSSLFAAYAATAGFDGVYTYDPLQFSPQSFVDVCAQARTYALRCSPSVNPGYNDTRIRPSTAQRRSRDGGARYDAYWRGAMRSGADVVSITSYNEWHEGTQIEPAVPKCITGSTYCYEDFEGTYGRSGASAARAFLDRTRQWTDALRSAVG